MENNEPQLRPCPFICDCYQKHGEKSVCYGTKEMEECTCDGAPSMCNFYPEKRANAPLKPCPFCGGPAIMKTTRHIPNGTDYTPQCTNPSCPGRITKKWGTKETAVYAWNRRTGNGNV